MPKRIQEDHKDFRDVISGRTRRELKRLIKTGSIVRQRGRGGKINITIRSIDIPRFLFGDTGEGVGRGPGKKGDVIRRDPQKGKGGGAGDESGEGITIQLDLEDVLRFLQNELNLPDMKPKPSETYEEIKYIYNNISKTGPESLRHTRRTLLETLKRMAMGKNLDNYKLVPGSAKPIRLLTPINSDRRYRQYTERKIPTSNAVIFFARDCSGSMSDFHCDVVSDMAWWIDVWIRKFYERVERCYLIHDTEAEVVDEKKFYEYRFGGGTHVSSAFVEIAKQLENKYPPHQYNVYIFYFGDGDNWEGDNEKIVDIIKEKLNPNFVNMIGSTQIMPYRKEGSLHAFFSEAIEKGISPDFLRLANIGSDTKNANGFGPAPLSDEDRDEQIMKAIKTLLGKERKVSI
jgi:uncharacterized sporulation protein YeaH/YhbH (DUF444 family)